MKTLDEILDKTRVVLSDCTAECVDEPVAIYPESSYVYADSISLRRAIEIYNSLDYYDYLLAWKYFPGWLREYLEEVNYPNPDEVLSLLKDWKSGGKNDVQAY